MDDRQPLSDFSLAIAASIDALREQNGVTQTDIAEVIGRNQTYVSYRVNLKHPWSTSDLDLMAPLFGTDAFGIVSAAREMMSSNLRAVAKSRPQKPD